MEFYERLQPAKKEHVLRKPGWFIWGASVCRHKDLYYIFATGWEEKYGFKGWVKHSTIFRGVSHQPEGPFELLGEMEELKKQEWSGEVLHNPTIHQVGDQYYLFYIGTKYGLNEQTKALPDAYEVYRYNQQIGVAVSDNPAGDFRPFEGNPILQGSKGAWDGTYVTNPAVCVDDGKFHMIYKALISEKLPEIVMKLGITAGEQITGPYKKLLDHPLMPYNIEDPFIWKEDGMYYLLVKDMTGELSGGPDEAVLLESTDLRNFRKKGNNAAYTTAVDWESGREYYQNVERPQIYFEHGKPVCLYNAVRTMDGKSFNLARRFR